MFSIRHVNPAQSSQECVRIAIDARRKVTALRWPAFVGQKDFIPDASRRGNVSGVRCGVPVGFRRLPTAGDQRSRWSCPMPSHWSPTTGTMSGRNAGAAGVHQRITPDQQSHPLRRSPSGRCQAPARTTGDGGGSGVAAGGRSKALSRGQVSISEPRTTCPVAKERPGCARNAGVSGGTCHLVGLEPRPRADG